MTLSTGTRNLKFMQRGAANASAAAGPSSASAPSSTRAVDPAHWVLPSAATTAAKGKGKAKAEVQEQYVEFEGSYLPFLHEEDEEEAPSGGRRVFGQAPKPVIKPVEPEATTTTERGLKVESQSVKGEQTDDDRINFDPPPKTFMKPAGFEDIAESKPKLQKAKRKNSVKSGEEDVVQGARAKKKPRKKVVAPAS